MKKNNLRNILKISLLILSGLCCLLCGQHAVAKASANDLGEPHYIFDKHFPVRHTEKPSASQPYLSGGSVTADALELFRTLEQKYAVNSIEELSRHYERVRRELASRFPQAEAQRLFENYRRYLDCQIAIVNDSRFETTSMDPKALLMQLSEIQNFRRDKLGREAADALFGKAVKEQEYILRRLIIIGRPDQYGKEKERQLQKLRQDMWGNEAVSLGEDKAPYNLYEQKLQLYARDLSEMDGIRRGQQIEEFRKAFFTPEQIGRMHRADAAIAAEEENLRRYRAKEKKILKTPGMSQPQRNQAIKALQDEYFGAEADAFRRREAMQKGLQNK